MARRGDGIYLRGKTWWLDFSHDSQRYYKRLGKHITRRVAGELATAYRGAVLKGEAGIGPKRRTDLLFDDAVKEFLAWVEANRRWRTLRGYRQGLDALKLACGGKRLGDLSPFLLEKHKRERLAVGARVAPNRELAALRALVNHCRKLGLYDGPNPVQGVAFLEEPRGRLRILDEAEEARLVGAAAGGPLRTYILAGIHAGLRLNAEGLTLQWPDIDLRRGLLSVEAAYSKNRTKRVVPINSTLRAALLDLKAAARGPYVFAKPDGAPYRSLRTSFRTACKRAGLKGITPHVLRHTFASRLAMAGVDPRTIQELGGWASLEMVQRYTHLSPTHKAQAVERIATRAAANFPTPARHLEAVTAG